MGERHLVKMAGGDSLTDNDLVSLTGCSKDAFGSSIRCRLCEHPVPSVLYRAVSGWGETLWFTKYLYIASLRKRSVSGNVKPSVHGRTICIPSAKYI